MLVNPIESYLSNNERRATIDWMPGNWAAEIRFGGQAIPVKEASRTLQNDNGIFTFTWLNGDTFTARRPCARGLQVDNEDGEQN